MIDALLRRAAFALALALPLPACLSAADDGPPPEPPGTLLVPGTVPVPSVPTVDTTGEAAWLCLTSGEWIKGKVIVLDRETLTFKSAELGELKIDWGDVAELRTARDFTLLLEGRVQTVGEVRVVDDSVLVTADGATRSIPRSDLVRMVAGVPKEANYWSGKLGIGGTLRRGNTDSLDYTTALDLLRRTAHSRLPIEYRSAYGKLEGVNNTDNERLKAHYDRFLSTDLFITPLGVEVYRDQFQNIALRVSPYTGLGCTLVDGDPVEWDVTAALGYRYTEYESVTAGQDDSDGSSTGIFGTEVGFTPAAAVEVGLDYRVEIGLEDTSETNQTAAIEVSVDLWWDLDLDVRLEWDRVGAPQPDSSGQVPEKDDVQLKVGLSWSF